MISKVIIYVMVLFTCVGAIDIAFFNKKHGYGKEFEEGLNAMGPLALAMVGIMCLAPVLGRLLTPMIAPMFNLIGADPAMFAGSLLAIDMGGYPLAQVMTDNGDITVLSGIILGSMMGCTIVFSIPVSISIVEEEDFPYLAKGMMIGIVAIPIGSFAGALMASIPVDIILINLVPGIALALRLVVGLLKVPKLLLKGFSVFSKFVTLVIIIGLTSAIIEALTGFVVIPGMDPIGAQLEIIGYIAITLTGAYPLVYFITTKLSKPLMKVGRLLDVNDIAVAGIIASLANSIPTFGMLKNMDKRGKVISIAFAVPAVAALGDHLGYTSANAPEYIFPMVAGKLLAGVTAVVFALVFLRFESKSVSGSDDIEKSVENIK